MAISQTAMTASWSGVVTPMTAPNEIKTVADAKSAFNKLDELYWVYYSIIFDHRTLFYLVIVM
jgi:hypothetical protein